MILLALDTASAACSVAVLRDGAIAAHRFERMMRGHAEALMPMVMAVLEECGIAFDGVDRIAVTVGPGSFTGIRTGIATARGLALARGIPVTAVTTLEAVAFAARRGDSCAGSCGDRRLLAVLETRRADLYCQLFAPDLSPLSAPAAMLPEPVAALAADGRVRVAGDGVAALGPYLGSAGDRVEFVAGHGLPDAAEVAFLAAERAFPLPGTPAPEPLYLHPPLATVPASGGRIRP